jgi:beta-phosphoglucomutase-like phosphatase (HAD superfamily)
VPPATLFDYNGVLVDDEVTHLEAFRDVLRPLGVDVSERDYSGRYLGFDDVGAFRAMLGDAGRVVTETEVRALVEAKKPCYLARARSSLRAFDGAAALVRRRAGVGPVGIVSGALAGEIALGIELLGVADVIAFVVSAEDTRACKPDPEGYRIALGKLGASGQDAVVIEDSLAGVHAAKAAGLLCIGVAHSYSIEELRAAGADLAVSRIAELEDRHFAELGHG